MARKRASMRDGPLAELFKATEAAQRHAPKSAAAEPATRRRAPAPEPDEPTVEHAPPFEVVSEEPKRRPRARRPRPAREPGIQTPVVRYLEPLPEPAPRLHRAPPPETAAYLAVIRVVGVGGAGLNAI